MKNVHPPFCIAQTCLADGLGKAFALNNFAFRAYSHCTRGRALKASEGFFWICFEFTWNLPYARRANDGYRCICGCGADSQAAEVSEDF